MNENINDLLNKIKNKHDIMLKENIKLNDNEVNEVNNKEVNDNEVNNKEVNNKEVNDKEVNDNEVNDKEVNDNEVNDNEVNELSVEKSIWMNKKLKYGIMAFRPWSLPASLVPLFLSGIIIMLKGTGTMLSFNYILGFMGTLVSHSFANGMNTYYDFKNKIDDHNSDDKGLIDNYIDINTLENTLLIMGSTMICLFGIILSNIDQKSLLNLLLMGISLLSITLFYTFKMFSIKYFGKGMGELSIFLCFGPLLMEGVSVILSGGYDFDIFLMSLPIGLTTVNILHANNVRDLESDVKNSIKTGAYYLDELNFTFYQYVFALSYFIPIITSLCLSNNNSIYNFWRSLTLLFNLPWTTYLLKCFENKNFHELPQKTAQHNLLFGFILITTILPFDMYARLLLGMLFYLGGVNNILVYQHAHALVYDKLKMIIPDIGETIISFLLMTAIIGQLFSSLLFILGIYPKLAVQIMIAFLTPVTFIVHNFWTIEDESPKKVSIEKEVPVFPSNFDSEFVNFFKNIGMIGGCLVYLLLD